MKHSATAQVSSTCPKTVKRNSSTRSDENIDPQRWKEAIAQAAKQIDMASLTSSGPRRKTLSRPTPLHQRNQLPSCVRPQLKAHAKALALKHRIKEELLVPTDLQEVLAAITKHNTPPHSQGKNVLRLNYDDYRQVRQEVPQSCKHYFTAFAFHAFRRDQYDRIDASAFWKMILHNFFLQNERYNLLCHYESEPGWLKEEEVAAFVSDLATSLPRINRLPPYMMQAYRLMASRKLYFFLDPLRRGKIKTTNLLLSDEYQELACLRNPSKLGNNQGLSQNWFSAESLQHHFSEFRRLDKDAAGKLSLDDMLHYKSGSLTKAFLTRLFQEIPTIGGRMDFKEYLNLCLALDNKSHPVALRYFFRVFDINKKGYLTCFDLNYFFRDILVELAATEISQADATEEEMENRKIEDIVNQTFDLVGPACPFQIRLKDIQQCKMAQTFVSILISVPAFEDWDLGAAEEGTTKETAPFSLFPRSPVPKEERATAEDSESESESESETDTDSESFLEGSSFEDSESSFSRGS